MSRILVVEDSPTQAQELRLTLESEGYDVAVALDGEQGLDLLAASNFDLVVTDILMPGISGYQLCRTIKDNPAWRHLPVILLTTLSDPAAIVQGIECGADNFIPKPYRPEHLLGRIRSIFTNRNLRAEKRFQVGIEVEFLGKRFTITSEMEQILDLLLSTCENIVRTNLDLQASQAELRAAKARIEEHNHLLQNQFRQVWEKSLDGMRLTDERGVVLQVNDAYCYMLGKPKEELEGKPFASVYAEQERQEFLATYLSPFRRPQYAALFHYGVQGTHSVEREEGVLGDIELLSGLAGSVLAAERRPRRDRAEAFGRAVPAVAKDGGSRPTGGWGGSRLQQPVDGHHWLQ